MVTLRKIKPMCFSAAAAIVFRFSCTFVRFELFSAGKRQCGWQWGAAGNAVTGDWYMHALHFPVSALNLLHYFRRTQSPHMQRFLISVAWLQLPRQVASALGSVLRFRLHARPFFPRFIRQGMQTSSRSSKHLNNLIWRSFVFKSKGKNTTQYYKY